MLLLRVYLVVSAVLGALTGVATLVLWSRRRDSLAKPGRASVWCHLSQSMAAAAAVALFWPLAAVAAVVVPVAVVVWRFAQPTPLQRDGALYREFENELKSR